MAKKQVAFDPALHRSRPYRPLIHGPKEKIEFDNEENLAYRYEIFIPAAIWRHSAVRAFLAYLEGVEPGATIFKGALGVWKKDVEDVNIYVMILKKGDWIPDNVRTSLRDAIADMMARLAEWKESFQKAFLFTETQVTMNMTYTVNADALLARFDEQAPAARKPRAAEKPAK
jgi:hypothetical protein